MRKETPDGQLFHLQAVYTRTLLRFICHSLDSASEFSFKLQL